MPPRIVTSSLPHCPSTHTHTHTLSEDRNRVWKVISPEEGEEEGRETEEREGRRRRRRREGED